MMKRKYAIACLILSLLIFTAPISFPSRVTSPDQPKPDTTDFVSITGHVGNPLNLSLAQIMSCPMVSEVAELKCVDGSPDVIYDWVGVPLCYLMAFAEIEPTAVKLAIHGSDGFSSDLSIDDAMRPTTLLAIGATETGQLPTISGIQGVYRIVAPGQWGYKWVGYVDQIDAVNYDYKGTYENIGYSDQANVSDSPVLPQLSPQMPKLTFAFNNQAYTVQAFTNVSITSHTFNYSKQEMNLSVTVPASTSGFLELDMQQSFLNRPYNVTIDSQPANLTEGVLPNETYLLTFLAQGTHTVTVLGANSQLPEFQPFPSILLFLLATLMIGVFFRRRVRKTQ